jgi:hypothetical protein
MFHLEIGRFRELVLCTLFLSLRGVQEKVFQHDQRDD